MRTLLLNADYSPIQVISWQRAICLWFSDKVEIVEEYSDEDIKSISFTMKCPAVVRLLKYKRKVFKERIKFSRYNIFYRDAFECQYCGTKGHANELTFDHVLPKLHGGRTEWTNIVTACHPCNSKKGSKLLHESGMILNKKPYEPSPNDLANFRFFLPKTPDAWQHYLYLNKSP